MPDRSTAPTVAGALTLGAGLAHAATAADHAGQEAAVVLFVIVGVAQVVIGATVLFRPSRPFLLALVGTNAGAAVAWMVSRTAGLPSVLELGGREAFGAGDTATTVAELVAVVAAVVACRAPAVGRRRLSPLLIVAVAPALVGLAFRRPTNTSRVARWLGAMPTPATRTPWRPIPSSPGPTPPTPPRRTWRRPSG